MYQVMVVDDEAFLRKAVGDILRRSGYEVRLCPDAGTCLRELRREKPDLLLLDVDLPDGNGIQLCRRIKEDPELRDVAVMLITGEAVEVDARVVALRAGAEDYVLKPFRMAELRARIARILKVAARPSRS